MERRGACVAFGTFEFVHKGHIEVAKRVVEIAKEHGLQSVIVSCPKDGEVYTTEKEKEYLLKGTGVEIFETYQGVQSIRDILLYIKQELHAAIVVIGRQNKNLEEIEMIARDLRMQLDVVEAVSYDKKLITCRWVAEAFEANDFELLTNLCGHPYVLIGDVVHGKKLGRTVGMPTINLHIYKAKKRPNCGVYATKVVLDEETYKAATNIGKRPTVDDFDYVTIETFILDFNKQIYGEVCVLEVHDYLREVKKFDSLEAVRLQVEKDVEQIRKKFREV